MSTRPNASLPRFVVMAAALAALLIAPAAMAGNTPDPATVTVPGDFQEELGCPGDWQPDCADTYLTYDDEDDVWQQSFDIPAGLWNYKAALNDDWVENYGANAVLNGDNISLDLSEETSVKFYYSHETHWITSNANSIIATAPGSFQEELGCSGDWQPWCLRSWLQDPDGDGIYGFTTNKLPAGDYEVKVAIDESWDENYGQDGVLNGSNIPFNVPNDCTDMRFDFDPVTKILTVNEASAAFEQPMAVTVAGSFQEELGCPGDWQPDCVNTHLTFDAEDDVWQGVFNIPAGNWEYKAPINNSWDENYGANATLNGANIPLDLAEATDVKFYYDHRTNWITSNQNATIATLAGSFQEELGCSGDWQPWCLRSWLQDPDGDGFYTFSTSKIPAGNWEVKIAINESWDENYGEGGARDGANIQFTVPSSCTEVFFTYDAVSHVLTITTDGSTGPQGNLNTARAHWVNEDTIAWDSSAAELGDTVVVHYALDGDLSLGTDGVAGGETLGLTFDPAGLPADVTAKFPHLASYSAYRVDASDLATVPMALTGRLAVSSSTGDGLLDATSVQIPGVLDDLYTYDGDLGVTWQGAIPTVRLWAPTAQNVLLHLFDDADPATSSATVEMEYDADTGVWSTTGAPGWKWMYYLYEVTVYAPTTEQVEVNQVTDPYSFSLSANSQRSQFVNLRDSALKPPGWEGVRKPRLDAPEDVVLYELHVRDFSIGDETVSEDLRGTFAAFTEKRSNGMRHLTRLARSGMTHVHLLPSFDIATVTERRDDQVVVDEALLETYAPDSEEQQAAITAVQDQDGFNWGYDPYHYTVPEGSYSTDPDGGARIREFRSMVKSLSEVGLRVVMDVVYNHTNSAGQNDKSVLDKIVPGYYHRLNADGVVETSSCCPNTASEHNMMEKLMIDSLLVWAAEYKVDGFRFDLMGHHMKSNMIKVREALDGLTKPADGVDGDAIYVYGEGWNFGEVANGARGENAIQANMAGTGIGSFNDRVRDAARGGGPFDGLQDQGFLTGLYFDPNATDQGDLATQADNLKLNMDQIRVSLTGNLKDYTFTNRFGDLVNGTQVDYKGQQAGYTEDPQEIINYVAAHDNETLFDAIQFKVPLATSTADRARVQNLGTSLVILSQGIPFIHAGQDMLRSKSLDRDSFNSGDWFNRLDFTYQDNNWGGGLPVASKNQDNWPLMQPLLADSSIVPTRRNILSSVFHFREMLRIRKSSKLFRLRTAEDVMDRVRFLNTGSNQEPGVIVMQLNDADGGIDCKRAQVVVVFNATTETVNMSYADYEDVDMVLHRVQRRSLDRTVRESSFDEDTGTFTVPARTTAVFEEPSECHRGSCLDSGKPGCRGGGRD